MVKYISLWLNKVPPVCKTELIDPASTVQRWVKIAKDLTW